MGAVDTTYTFTATDTITSTKMNNIIDQTTITGDAIFGTTLEVSSGKLKVRSQGITSNELATNSVTTDKIRDLNVITIKIADDAVTTIKIADDAVTSDKIAIGAIVPNLPSNFPIQIRATTKTDVQIIDTDTTSWVDLLGLSLTLTRAVVSASGKVRIQAVIQTSSNTSEHGVALRIMRDTTVIGIGDAFGSRTRVTSNAGYAGGWSNVPDVIDFIDTAPGSSSTVTYKIQARMYSANLGYINRSFNDTDIADYSYRTISTLTLTELTP